MNEAQILAHSAAWLIISLLVILGGCNLFSNGVEWIGRKLRLGEGAVGSVLAAVGTALPETMVPIIAILFGRGQHSIEVGAGAIAGAPFMLSTLAFFVTGTSVVAYSIAGRRSLPMQADPAVIGRDVKFFLAVYAAAVVAIATDVHAIRYATAPLLVLAYAYYVYRTFKEPGELGSDLADLHIARAFGLQTRSRFILLQVLLGLGLILVGAHEFVRGLEHMSRLLGVSPLVLSIIITPIATELPEKINSVLWTRVSKDTLALGNITGAMVFQSCIPVALGVSLVNAWHLSRADLASALLALASAGVTYAMIRTRRKISAWALLSGGAFYLIFFVYVFGNAIHR